VADGRRMSGVPLVVPCGSLCCSLNGYIRDPN
jgi:hypothetical protein